MISSFEIIKDLHFSHSFNLVIRDNGFEMSSAGSFRHLILPPLPASAPLSG
jgi:hypothetical protein